MELDINTRRNLELTETMRDKSKKGSLFGILDKTKTGMGARRLKSWIDRPLIEADAINNRLEAVNEFVLKPELRDTLRDSLKKIHDIEMVLNDIISFYRKKGIRPNIYQSISD